MRNPKPNLTRFATRSDPCFPITDGCCSSQELKLSSSPASLYPWNFHALSIDDDSKPQRSTKTQGSCRRRRRRLGRNWLAPHEGFCSPLSKDSSTTTHAVQLGLSSTDDRCLIPASFKTFQGWLNRS